MRHCAKVEREAKRIALMIVKHRLHKSGMRLSHVNLSDAKKAASDVLCDHGGNAIFAQAKALITFIERQA